MKKKSAQLESPENTQYDTKTLLEIVERNNSKLDIGQVTLKEMMKPQPLKNY